LDLKDDLVDMSDTIQKNYIETLAEEGHDMPSEKNTWRIQVKGREQPRLVNKPTFAEDKEKEGQQLDKAVIDEKTKKLKDELMEEAKLKQEKAKKEEFYSSGLESDNDLDLLVEQEVLAAIKMRKQLKKKL
jgi:hypothetical protein